MMKKAVSFLLGGIFSLSVITSPTVLADDRRIYSDAASGIIYEYSVNPDGKTAELLSAVLPGQVRDTAVPKEIEGYKITSLGSKAYVGNFYLEKIEIPSHIGSIGTQAFMSCNELREVVIGEGITEIPEDCFFSCPKLVTAELPDSLISIGSEAFFGCEELDITVPESVTEIGYDAIGKKADSQSSDTVAVRGFLIKGASGSCAEKYAAENGIDFIDPNDFLAGDVNNDGVVDASDASDVLGEYAGTSTGSPALFTKKQVIMGDMNGDDAIDSSDASQILTIYAENSTKSDP